MRRGLSAAIGRFYGCGGVVDRLRGMLTILKWSGVAFFAALALFLFGTWIGSSIARNGEWEEPQAFSEPVIEILVGTNGIHTEIAMPIATTERDWSAVFPASDIAASDLPYTHVAVSWGERAFFLETPTWADLDPIVAGSAMFGGEGIMHVAHYVRPAPSDDYRVLHLRQQEYRALADDIAAQLAPAQTRETITGYGAQDVFYTANGTYHAGNTCNQWTADRLAAAGIKVGYWTPFSGSVMKWIPKPQSAD